MSPAFGYVYLGPWEAVDKSELTACRRPPAGRSPPPPPSPEQGTSSRRRRACWPPPCWRQWPEKGQSVCFVEPREHNDQNKPKDKLTVGQTIKHFNNIKKLTCTDLELQTHTCRNSELHTRSSRVGDLIQPEVRMRQHTEARGII